MAQSNKNVCSHTYTLLSSSIGAPAFVWLWYYIAFTQPSDVQNLEYNTVPIRVHPKMVASEKGEPISLVTEIDRE